MSKKLCLVLLAAVLLARPASAQITISYPTFTAGTVISPDEVNSNFTTLADNALNRTGGTMTGTLTSRAIIPSVDLTYALGDATHYYSAIYGRLTQLTIASQAAYDLLYASSATVWARLANGTTGQVLTATSAGAPSWAAGIPAGTIVFTSAGSCGTGWSEYTALRGRYAVGLPSGGTNTGTSGTALSDLEARAVGQHTHTATTTVNLADAGHVHGVTDPGHSHTTNTFAAQNGAGGGIDALNNASSNYSAGAPFAYQASAVTGISVNSATSGVTVSSSPTTVNNSGSVAGTNAPYIQLMACAKS